MPLFRDPETHALLIRCLELQVVTSGAFGTEGGSSGSGGFAFGASRPDVVVGLDARGFLFGPALALRLGAGFVAVRKKGKLPGPCVTAAYEKEYGSDFFQMQEDALAPGQKVLIVDDIIATGKNAFSSLPPPSSLVGCGAAAQ